jgi:hypothetical protein
MNVPIIVKKGRGVNILHNCGFHIRFMVMISRFKQLYFIISSSVGTASTAPYGTFPVLYTRKSDLCEISRYPNLTNERSVQPVHVFRRTTPGRRFIRTTTQVMQEPDV